CFCFEQLLFPAAAIIFNGGYSIGFTHAVDGDGGVASSAHIEGVVRKINFKGYVRIVPRDALRAAPFTIKAEAGNGIILKGSTKRHVPPPQSKITMFSPCEAVAIGTNLVLPTVSSPSTTVFLVRVSSLFSEK